MGLPSSRSTTYSPATPIKSADLNLIQDCLVGRKKPSNIRRRNASIPNVLSSSGTNSMTGSLLVYGSAGTFSGMDVGTIEEGERITAFGVRFKGTGAAITMKLDLMLNTGTAQTSLGQLQIVTPPATYADYSLVITTPHVMVSGESLYLDSLAQAAFLNMAISSVFLVTDRL